MGQQGRVTGRTRLQALGAEQVLDEAPGAAPVAASARGLELRRLGWRLHSHAERLAFSATPATFGALLVQRLRWANGGLVLVPRLLRALQLLVDGRAEQALFVLVHVG